MKKNVTLLFLICGLCLFSSPLMSQSRQEFSTELDVIHYDKPELIPNFLAWSKFLRDADMAYRLGGGYFRVFVKRKLRLIRITDNPKLLRTVGQLIADLGMGVERDVDKCIHEVASSRENFNRGLIPLETHQAEELTWLREEVRLVRAARDALEAGVLAADPILGSAFWKRIREFVEDGEVKASLTAARHRTPHDDEIWSIFESFDKIGGRQQ